MTDPKPATPSTDDCICEDVTVLDTRSLLYRIASDSETIKAERARSNKYEAESEQKGADLMAAESIVAEQAEEIEALRQAFGLLSTLAPKVVMAPSSPAEIVATAGEIHRSVSEEIERLETLTTEEVHTLRDQVETLREALAGLTEAMHGAAPSNGGWCTWIRDTLAKGCAALASTESKG